MEYSTGARGKYWKFHPSGIVEEVVMPNNRDQRKVVHTSCRRRFPHPYCSVRVGGTCIDYQVPIPNRAGWSSNAPPRKSINWCPSPRMEGETAVWELSKLMQSKREVRERRKPHRSRRCQSRKREGEDSSARRMRRWVLKMSLLPCKYRYKYR